MDEASILFWGEDILKSGKFFVYLPHETQFEMLSAYFFSIFKYPRIVASIMGLLNVFLLYNITKKIFDDKIALYSSLLLLLNPWHFYYSRLVATCTGVLTITLIIICMFIYIKKPLVKYFLLVIFSTLGLMYYTVFRIILLLILVYSLKEKKRGELFSLLLSIALFFIIVLFSGNTLEQVFTRGSYNFLDIEIDLIKNFFFTFLFPFIPVQDYYSHTSEFFMGDYVHAGFTRSLFTKFPLGVLGSLLSIGGLFITAKNFKKELVNRYLILSLFSFFILLGFMGPSFSRFFVVLPILTTFGAITLSKMSLKNKIAQNLIITLILTFIAFDSLSQLYNLNDRSKMEVVFPNNLEKIFNYLEEDFKNIPHSGIIVLPEHSFRSMRYLVRNSKTITSFPLLESEKMAQWIRPSFDGENSQYLIFPKIPKDAALISGFSKGKRTRDFMMYLFKHSNVINRKKIIIKGEYLADIFRINWH